MRDVCREEGAPDQEKQSGNFQKRESTPAIAQTERIAAGENNSLAMRLGRQRCPIQSRCEDDAGCIQQSKFALHALRDQIRRPLVFAIRTYDIVASLRQKRTGEP
jgi:hypothetical protein